MCDKYEVNKNEIAGNFSELMMILAVKFFKRLERQARHTMSPLQLNTLFTLGFEGPQTMSQLCGCIGVFKQQMTPLVDKLVEMDLVTRSQDPDDRRTVIISISNKGHEFMESTKADCANSIQMLMKDFPDEDIQTVNRASLDLIEVFKKLPDYDEE